MADEEKKDEAKEESEEKTENAEETKEEVKEEAEKAEESAEEAKDSAEEAKEAAEDAKESADDAKDSAEKTEEAKPKENPEESKEEPKKEVKVSGKLADIIKNIEGLSVLELSELVKALEDKFGVTAAAPVAAAAGTTPAGEGTEDGEDEGKSTFNVILADGGSNKIGVIKAVRELVPSLGLKEAKDLVDAAPKQVLEGAGKDAAAEAKKKLEEAGAKVDLQ